MFARARKRGVEAKEAQALVASLQITTTESDAFAELSEICLRKYGVGTQWAPEIGLAVILTGIGVRYVAAIGPAPKVESELPPSNGAEQN